MSEMKQTVHQIDPVTKMCAADTPENREAGLVTDGVADRGKDEPKKKGKSDGE